MELRKFDAVIIGGGASGLMCAIAAKNKNIKISVAIIEKNDRVGKKLLSTGNGRCNLTNENISCEKYSGSFADQSRLIFEKYTTDYLNEIFRNLGLLTFSDKEGRYYPISRQASSVLDVLRFSAERSGAEIFCNENIKSIKKQNNTFTVKTDTCLYKTEKLVIACGSKAAPKLGGNASASDYLKNFGHKFMPFSPALCPVKVKSDLLKSLKGIRAVCKATLSDAGGNLIKSEKGEVQFTDSALSGICIFNLSLYTKKSHSISLDLLPDISYTELLDILQKQKRLFSTQTTDNFFTGIFQKRLGQAVLKMSGVKDFSRNTESLTDSEIKSICKTVKKMDFEITENAGFEQAQCASGGVIGKEIDERSMESKLIKGLYICGETIDICGECGGYNLHFAFSSGHLAGESL